MSLCVCVCYEKNVLHKVKPYFQSAFTILQNGTKDAGWRRVERVEEMSKVSKKKKKRCQLTDLPSV